MLKILTWLWAQPGGRTQFTAEHVNIWAAMVRRHITMPHAIACVTDMPNGIASSIEIIDPPHEFDNVRIPTWGEKKPQCLRRISMFRPDSAEIFGQRFVCMDLDSVIADSLDPLFDHDDEFRICPGTSHKRPYNGSMMQLTAGARAKVYNEFTPRRAIMAGAKFLGSDQAWIGHVLGWNERTWSAADGVLWYESRYARKVPPCRVMFFPGSTKPWHVNSPLAVDRWAEKNYRIGTREAA